MKRILGLCLLPSVACLAPADGPRLYDANVQYATQYNHRGMVMNEIGVLQGDATITIPTKDEGSLRLFVFGNIDLSNDTGDAWMPNGHAWELTELDLLASYSRSIGGSKVLSAGIISYALFNGSDYALGPAVSAALTPRGETKELFVRLDGEIAQFRPYVALHLDVDEHNGWYVDGGARREWQLDEKLFFNVEGIVGLNDDKHALWTYGVPNGDGGGLADLRLVTSLEHDLSETTTLFGRIGYSTILGSEIADWFDVIEVETENTWLVLGAGWSR